MQSRALRILTKLVLTAVAVVVVLALVVVGLHLTNAAPGTSPGWRRVADMPNPRGEVASAVLGDRLVVVGGLEGHTGATSDAVSVYDAAADRWRPGPLMPEPRHHAGAAALDGWMYLAGGASSATDWTPHDDVWRFRPQDGWERVDPMPEGRQGHAMVSLDGRLYVLGGVGRTGRTLVYDPPRGWRTAAAIPFRRDHLRAVVSSELVWVLGGRAGDTTAWVDVYDPRRDAWQSAFPLPHGMSAMVADSVDGSIHVVGGEDPSAIGGGVFDTHVALEPLAQRWVGRPEPLLAVHGAGGGTVGGQLIIAGGASRQGALSVLSWTGVTQVYRPSVPRP